MVFPVNGDASAEAKDEADGGIEEFFFGEVMGADAHDAAGGDAYHKIPITGVWGDDADGFFDVMGELADEFPTSNFEAEKKEPP